MNDIYDVAIIGAGPAGLSSAIYTGRGGLKTVIIENDIPGGKLVKTYEVENYPGISKINGADLANQFINHGLSFGATLEFGQIKELNLEEKEKSIIFDDERIIKAKTIIIATGTKERQLTLKDSDKFTGRGISYCAVCDGHFYKNKDVTVIGGGNSAVEEALYLSGIVNKVNIVIRRDHFTAETGSVNKLLNNPKINIIKEHIPEELIIKDDKIIGLRIKNVKTNQSQDVNCEGIFPYIGATPSTELLPTTILNDEGYIIVNENMETSIEGVYGVGDVTNKKLRQIATAVNDGAIAGNNVIKYLK